MPTPNYLLPIAAIAGFFGLKAANAAEKDFSAARAKFKNWDKYDETFKKYALASLVPWEWLKAIAIVESSLGQNSRVESGGVSEDGKSYGLMQFTLPTAQRFGGKNISVKDLNNAETSIKLAAQYLSFLKGFFQGDERKIIMSYNQGEGNTQKGKEYAAGYYKKFQDALKIVREGNL